MSKKRRVAVPVSDLETHLIEQIRFLQKSIREYDAGDTTEFRRIASTLRVIFHNSRTSHSLFSQLKLDNLTLPSYAEKIDERNLLCSFPLAITCISGNSTYHIPILDQIRSKPTQMALGDWKAELVYKDPGDPRLATPTKLELTRWDFVLIVANQDGGSHVDPELDDRYARIVREGGGLVQLTESGTKPIFQLERVYLRHIAFEANIALTKWHNQTIGNRACSCGSERKARYCCQKGTLAN